MLKDDSDNIMVSVALTLTLIFTAFTDVTSAVQQSEIY